MSRFSSPHLHDNILCREAKVALQTIEQISTSSFDILCNRLESRTCLALTVNVHVRLRKQPTSNPSQSLCVVQRPTKRQWHAPTSMGYRKAFLKYHIGLQHDSDLNGEMIDTPLGWPIHMDNNHQWLGLLFDT